MSSDAKQLAEAEVFGPPGQAGDIDFDLEGDTQAHTQAPQRERRRWPACEASRHVVAAAAEVATLEQERRERTEAARQARIRWAMEKDNLPEIGGDFMGANLVGDEWVEVFREDLVRQGQRRQ